MVREKRDHVDDDLVESGQSESVPQDERSGESAEASSEPSPDAESLGDNTADEGQLDPPIAEPTSAAATPGANSLGQTPIDVPVESPPPLPPPAIASNSSIASAAEPAGISFGGLSPDTSTADAEPSMHDLVEREPGSAFSDIRQPFLLDTDPASPRTAPPSGSGDDAPLDSQSGSSSTRQLSPLFVETGSGERRVQKRLEIEVEVTVINQERIAQIASNKTLRTFSELADSSIDKVAQDLRTFRESYRDVWGRRF